MVERRREPRLRSLLGGRISFRRLQSTMDCIVRNIAPGGAMVVFPHTAVTPAEFRLEIPHRGETHSAKVIWRKHDRAGVELSEFEKYEVPIDTARRIRRLEAENRRLKRQLDPSGW
ncbi:MAG: PilZ domain-containing protein [Propylenella sp.]